MSTNSSSLLDFRADLSSPISPKQSSPSLGVADEENANRQQMRQSLREHLFGDGSAIYQEEASGEEEGGGFAETARVVRRRLSRTGTTIAKRASFRRSLNPLSRSTTSLPRDLSTELEDEEEIVSQIKHKAFHDKLAALNQPLHVTLEDDGVEEKIISPIRRRSLMTPGLATRDPTNILAKPPTLPPMAPESEHEYYYNRNLSESSPLARIAALDLADELFDASDRSATPLDRDYGNLGGPGALRVTNGVASPSPSMQSTSISIRKPTNDLPDYAEHFPLPLAQLVDCRPSALRLQVARRSGEFANASYENAKRQSGEVFRYGSDQRPSNTRDLAHLENFHRADPIEQIPTCNVLMPDKPVSPLSNLERDVAYAEAEEYMLDLGADNPFSAEVTTKPNEIEDALFDDQASARDFSLPSFENFSVEPFTVENDMSTDIDIVKPHESHDTESGSEDFRTSWTDEERPKERITERLEDHQLPCITKSDSGYSSGSSLNSTCEPIQLQERRPVRYNHRYETTIALVPPETIPKDSKNTPTRPQLATFPTTTTKSSLFACSYQNSSDTIPTVVSASSMSSQSSSTSRKLQKPRPKSMPPPINRFPVQNHLDVTSTSFIPPVPVEVAERNARRVRDLPPLNYTLPSVDHETLRTETARSPPVSAPVRFPTPSQESGSEGEFIDSRKMRRNSMRRSLLSTFKNQDKSSRPSIGPDDEADTIATLGDIARSLGDGPYEAASPRAKSNQQTMGRTPASQYHISASTPRSKSTIGMSDYEASEVSRIRTMYRRSSLENQYPRPQNPPRRVFNDRGGIPGRMPRPRPGPRDQPPLPSVPVAVRVQWKEAQLADHDQNYASEERSIPRLESSTMMRASDVLSDDHHAIDWTASRSVWASHRKSAFDAHVDLSQLDFGDDPLSFDLPQIQVQPSQKATRRSLPPPQHVPSRSRTEFLQIREQRPRQQPSAIPSEVRRKPQHAFSSPNLLLTAVTDSQQRPATTLPQPRNLNIPSGTVARLSGRFDGGFGYGYEPGYGVGGSAGTRSLLNKASRKSVPVSKGFGLDLSDVPVFIARNV